MILPRATSAGQYPHTRKPTPIYAPGKTKPIGRVEGEIFIKAIAFSKHALQRPPSIAFDVSTLDDAQRARATIIHVYDVETARRYSATIALVFEHGIRFNRGFGNQIALSLAFWRVDGAPSEVERNEAIQAARREQAGQLALFGG
jgi:hypothetical protein